MNYEAYVRAGRYYAAGETKGEETTRRVTGQALARAVSITRGQKLVHLSDNPLQSLVLYEPKYPVALWHSPASIIRVGSPGS